MIRDVLKQKIYPKSLVIHGNHKKNIPKLIPQELLLKSQEITSLNNSEIKAMYSYFRKLTPTGMMSLFDFKRTMGILGNLENSFLPIHMFNAFDNDGDGYLSFLEFVCGVGIMIHGNDDEKLELSFKILKNTSCIHSSDSASNIQHQTNYICLEEFKNIIDSLELTRKQLVGGYVDVFDEYYVWFIFNQCAKSNIDGKKVMSIVDFKNAVKHNPEFLFLLGISHSTQFLSTVSSNIGNICNDNKSYLMYTKNHKAYRTYSEVTNHWNINICDNMLYKDKMDYTVDGVLNSTNDNFTNRNIIPKTTLSEDIVTSFPQFVNIENNLYTNSQTDLNSNILNSSLYNNKKLLSPNFNLNSNQDSPSPNMYVAPKHISYIKDSIYDIISHFKRKQPNKKVSIDVSVTPNENHLIIEENGSHLYQKSFNKIGINQTNLCLPKYEKITSLKPTKENCYSESVSSYLSSDSQKKNNDNPSTTGNAIFDDTTSNKSLPLKSNLKLSLNNKSSVAKYNEPLIDNTLTPSNSQEKEESIVENKLQALLVYIDNINVSSDFFPYHIHRDSHISNYIKQGYKHLDFPRYSICGYNYINRSPSSLKIPCMSRSSDSGSSVTHVVDFDEYNNFVPTYGRMFINRPSVHKSASKRKSSIAHLHYRIKKRRAEYKLLRPPKGFSVYFGHPSWNIVLCMMMGIRLSAGRMNLQPKRKLESFDFTVKEKISILPFYRNASFFNPNFALFIDYAPHVFLKIREFSGVSTYDYLQSISPEQLIGNMVLGNFTSLSKLCTEGKSGSFFYYSSDGKFLIKTITRATAKFFKKILYNYYDHIISNPKTLITRFYGYHAIHVKKTKFYSNTKLYFLVMGNMFHTPVPLGRRYDLKGSHIGRETLGYINFDPSTQLKDCDMIKLREKIIIGEDIKEKLIQLMKNDADFLKNHMILDYSLLVGIHYIQNKEKDLYSMYHSNSVVSGMNTDETMLLSPQCKAYEDLGGILSIDGTKIYYLGIIDILTNWSIKKKLEYKFKSIKYCNNEGISCVPPSFYAYRFISFIESRIE